MSSPAAPSYLRLGAWHPASIRFSHMTLPTRDIAQSKRFFLEVLGGELVTETPLVRVHFRNFGVVLGPQDGGTTEPDREYPHYAFTVPADQFAPLKQRLEAYGIPTHDPWTRAGETHSLMYFRDPSGNQYELFCPEGDPGFELRIGANAGGDYVVPFSSLGYESLGGSAARGQAAPPVMPLEFNHLTLPSRSVGESKRFFTEIFGTEVTVDIPVHVSVVLGGFEFGYGGLEDGGWPKPDQQYPRFTLSIDPGELPPLKERLAAFGVPTSDIWTSDDVDASLYFRDPSGNLYEARAERGFDGPVRRRPGAGEDHVPDLESLWYDSWNDLERGGRP